MSDIRIDSADNFPPQEDGYERLWTPQRMAYVLGNGKFSRSQASHHTEINSSAQSDAPEQAGSHEPKASKPCPFCAAQAKADSDGLIIWRGEKVFAIMNLYPYNTGHLMICPNRHVGLLTDLTDEELQEFERATVLAMRVISHVSHPDGMNIGVNQGEVAGAGVASHLHQHVVPRWSGDSNFMPIIAQTRTMPVLLSNQRDAYAEEFSRLAGYESPAPAVTPESDIFPSER